MGTMTKPGRFDCLAKIMPDEPFFLLMARDLCAPKAVRYWAVQRRNYLQAGTIKYDDDVAQIYEAEQTSYDMEKWYAENATGRSVPRWRTFKPAPSDDKAATMVSQPTVTLATDLPPTIDISALERALARAVGDGRTVISSDEFRKMVHRNVGVVIDNPPASSAAPAAGGDGSRYDSDNAPFRFPQLDLLSEAIGASDDVSIRNGFRWLDRALRMLETARPITMGQLNDDL